jgi:hypothetical protein
MTDCDGQGDGWMTTWDLEISVEISDELIIGRLGMYSHTGKSIHQASLAQLARAQVS